MDVAPVHHQYLPDSVQYEPGALPDELAAALQKRGHRLKPQQSTYGNMQAIYWDRGLGEVFSASDPRGIGAARVAVGK